ncbi:MmgE/PrpD family protein [Consotaella aegiceratis]|uniref:MmgE/PrpD family protein n=1 Tax=Consotaella aegiceratis TaxID=3097961 RepID=UPI002F41BBD2
MTAPALQPLARYIATARFDGDDKRLRERLWMTLLDWSSALLAGTGHNLLDAYRQGLLESGATGPCSVVATPGRHPLSAAAATNAAISHLFEVDDAHRDSTSHPGITVVPAVMALAEARGLDAKTAAAAIVAGIETVLRVGSYLGARHYGICHTTATAGSLGAAAAAARAIGLDEAATLAALGHAGTQAAGLWAFLDDDAKAAKAFHAATAVRNGIAAARLAEAGIPSAVRILEGPRGMRAAWKLDDCDPDWLIPGDEPMIHRVTVKGWPVCGQMHSALDCAAALAKADPLFAAGDAPVTVDLPAGALAIAVGENPQTVADAKFATAFCIAAVLCARPPSFSGLNDALLADAQIRSRADTVKLREDPAFTARFPAERPARVTIHGKTGDLSEERSFRQGDPEAPWSHEAMIERTRAVLALTPLQTDPAGLVDWCDRFADANASWKADELFHFIETPAGQTP